MLHYCSSYTTPHSHLHPFLIISTHQYPPFSPKQSFYHISPPTTYSPILFSPPFSASNALCPIKCISLNAQINFILWIVLWTVLWMVLWIVLWMVLWMVLWIVLWMVLWMVLWIVLWMVLWLILWMILWILWIILWILSEFLSYSFYHGTAGNCHVVTDEMFADQVRIQWSTASVRRSVHNKWNGSYDVLMRK